MFTTLSPLPPIYRMPPQIGVDDDAVDMFPGATFSSVVDRLAKYATSNHFMTNKSLSVFGLMATKTASSQKQRDLCFQKLYHIAPSTPDSTLTHCVLETTYTKNGEPRRLPRGTTVFGSTANITWAIASSYVSPSQGFGIKNFTTAEMAAYWESYHVGHIYVHPYVDIDIKAPPSASFSDVFSSVYPSLVFVQEELVAYGGDGGDFDDFHGVVFYCVRPIGDEVKHSFHVHWPGCVLEDASKMAAIARAANLKCGDVLDCAPYSMTKQLFRMPYCGKNGDSSAVLRPITFSEDTSGVFSFQYADVVILQQALTAKSTGDTSSFNEAIQQLADCITKTKTFSLTTANLRFVRLPSAYGASFVTTSIPRPTQHQDAVGVPITSQHNKWLAFWLPVLRWYVLPNFTTCRKRHLNQLGLGIEVPRDDRQLWVTLPTSSFHAIQGFESSFRVDPITTDRFCEYDNREGSPHTHTEDGVITYTVDLFKGKIAQNCLRCRPRISDLNWYHFIQRGRVDFMPMIPGLQSQLECDEVFTIDKAESAERSVFFLAMNFDTVVMDQSQNNAVLAFREEDGIWIKGSFGNRLLLKLLNDLNERYKQYRRARIHEKTQSLLAGNPSEEQAMVAIDAAKAATDKIPNLWVVTDGDRAKFIDRLQSCPGDVHVVSSMEMFPNLVPLEKGLCVDVFTWEEKKSLSKYYFTSAINASLCDLREPTVDEFVAWQTNVCCGDAEYALWKQWIFALSLTHFNFDRCFYFALGPKGRNGKSSEVKMFADLLLRNGSGAPPRGFALTRSYLSEKAQGNQSANGTDTLTIEGMYKTYGVVEEVAANAKLATSTIKQITSGDGLTGRKLFAAESTTVVSKYSLWLVGNKLPPGAWGTDHAFNERARILPYNAQWVTDAKVEEERKKDPDNADYIFVEDSNFVTDVVTSSAWRNAAVTKCLRELHLFFKNECDFDHAIGRPTRMKSFPVPRVVREHTDAHITSQHPLLTFIRRYLQGPDKRYPEKECATLQEAFQELQAFAQIENTNRFRYMDKAGFEQSLVSEKISVKHLSSSPEVKYLVGYKLIEGGVPRGKFSRPFTEIENYEGVSYTPAAKKFK